MPSLRYLLFSAALAAGLYGLCHAKPPGGTAVDLRPSRCNVLLNRRLDRQDYGPESARLAGQLRRELTESCRRIEADAH